VVLLCAYDPYDRVHCGKYQLVNNKNVDIYYTYEFRHTVDGRADHTVKDIQEGIKLKAGAPPASWSNTLVVSVSDLGQGKHIIQAYTRLEVGTQPFHSDLVSDRVDDEMEFVK